MAPKIEAQDNNNKVTITLDGDTADISAGGNLHNGSLVLLDKTGKPGVSALGGLLDPEEFAVGFQSKIFLGGANGTVRLADGPARLIAGASTLVFHVGDRKTIVLDGGTGDGQQAALSIGAANQDGRIDLVSNQGETSLSLHSHAADGVLVWDIFHLKRLFALNRDNATLFIGAHASDGGGLKPGSLRVRDMNGSDSIVLDGESGDISLTNADCAEEFAIADSAFVDPGTVVVLDQDGRIRQSTEAYDTRVAGVISGAGDCRPGLVLDRRDGQHNRVPVALVGKTFCKVDAQYGGIQVGDLLTTSSTPGHAMKASDPARSFGAVIGKAVRPLSSGTGLIPVLIALQ